MSTPQPGTPRRRRIAGERRRPAETTPERALTPAPPRAFPATEPEQPAQPEHADELPPPYFQDDLVGTDDQRSLDGDDELDETRPRTSYGWWGSRVSLIVLGVLLALLLAGVTLLALGLLGSEGPDGIAEVKDAQAVERATRTAPPAAEAAAAAILAYDFRSLDADQDSAVRFMTKDFATEYADTFERVVRPAAEQNKARVTATVQASGVIRATPDTARVLVFVDQSTTSKANRQPQVALNRVEMSMVREGDSWLVDDISSY
jgi:Mce-associated membrane protein